MNPKSMILDLKRNLCTRNLEKALYWQRPYTADGWSPLLKKEGLTVDLSKVGWVEPSALARVTLLIEAIILGTGADVTVLLPRTVPTHAESEKQRAAEHPGAGDSARLEAQFTSAGIERRKKASVVLRRFHFEDGLHHEHLLAAAKAVVFESNYDWSLARAASQPMAEDAGQPDEESLETDDPDPVETSPVESDVWYFDDAWVFPLQWVATAPTEKGWPTIETLAAARTDLLESVLRHGSGRVQGCDTRMLAYVFGEELVANVQEHGKQDYALLAAWERPKDLELKDHEVLNCERDFARWVRRYPLVELTVGDSGKGIPAVLGRAYAGQKPLPDPESLCSKNDQISAWAFDKWSTTASAEDLHRGKRGTRGLYRVRRVASKYSGCVTLRTETSLVGYDYSGSGKDSRIAESLCHSRLARWCGTFVHARVPVMPAERHAEALLSRLGSPLQYRECDLSGWDGRPETIERQLTGRILAQLGPARKGGTEGTERAGSTAPPRQVCVIADFGFRPIAYDVLEQVLEDLTLVAHSHIIVAANLIDDRGGDVLDAILEGLRTAPPLESKMRGAKGDAVLVRRPSGDLCWVGVPAAAAPDEQKTGKEEDDIFSLLLRSGEVTLAEVRSRFPETEDQERVLGLLRECDHIARYEGKKRFTLAFDRKTLGAKLRAVDAKAVLRARKDLLEGAIPDFSKECFGAPPNVCRTPSLELVGQFAGFNWLFDWLDERQPGRHLDTRAAYALARETRDRLPLFKRLETVPDVIHIVADAKVPSRLVHSYGRALERLLEGPRSIQVTVARLGPGDRPQFNQDAAVLIFADLIQSESTIKRLLSQVVRSRRLPDAIVCLVDARAQRGPHKYNNRNVDLLSLGTLELILGDKPPAGRIVNIGPEDFREEHLREEDSEGYAIEGALLEHWLEDCGAVYREHITAPNGRHFGVYVDAYRLLTAKAGSGHELGRYGARVLLHYRRAIDEWLRGRTLHAVCYPADEKPSAAELIARRLAERYTPLVKAQPLYPNWTPSDLPEAQTPETYQAGLFHDKGAPDFERVVIVDWGSVTGRRVRDLLSLVATKASEALVVILLSQGSKGEERFLRSLGEVAVGTGGRCQAAVKFLARLPVPAFDRANCPYCMQLDRLETEELFYPTDLFQGFVADLKGLLKPVDLDSLRLSDTGTGPKEARDIVEVLRWRAAIERASRSTAARQELFDRLRELDQPDPPAPYRWQRRIVVGLLAAEWTLLKKPALNLHKFKDLVSRLAVGLISESVAEDGSGSPSRSAGGGPADDEERADDCRNSITVLRTASKTEFAASLPALFETLLKYPGRPDKREALLQQLLYCAFTYLQRRYQVSATLEPLVKSLGECSKLALQRRVSDPEEARVDLSVHALNQYALHQQRLLELQETGRLTAYHCWRDLDREFIPKWEPHHFSEAMMFLNSYEPWLKDNTREQWERHRERWVKACCLASDILLPRLEPLKDIFIGLDATDTENLRLLTTSTAGLSRMLSEMTEYLSWLVEDPSKTQDADFWRDFARLRGRLLNLIFHPERSTLAQLLRGCPANLSDIVENLYASPQEAYPLISWRSWPVPRDVAVFCHTNLVQWVIGEALANIPKHNDLPDRESQFAVQVRIQETGKDKVTLVILSNGTEKEIPSRKRALGNCLTRLRVYGGDLRHGRVERDLAEGASWSYEVRVDFLKWVGGN